MKIDVNCKTFKALFKSKDKKDHDRSKGEIEHLIIMSYCCIQDDKLYN
jgi:hypothetical protein